MSSSSDQRVRHVAIVLQSLDAATSRGLLSQLPPAQSKSVRQAMVNLGTVSPQERAAAFEAMQGLLAAAGIRVPTSNREESDADLSPAAALLAQSSAGKDRIEWSSAAAASASSTPQQASATGAGPDTHWQLPANHATHGPLDNQSILSRMPADTLADILQGERPIVIATVINQVSLETATSIVQSLPIAVAGATLAALPHLHLTDPAILKDIQLELERKIGQYEPPRQATAEGLAKLQAILASMPATQHDIWTNAVAQSNPILATKLGWRQPPTTSSPASDSPKELSFQVAANREPNPKSGASSRSNTPATSPADDPNDIFEPQRILPIGNASKGPQPSPLPTRDESSDQLPAFSLNNLRNLNDRDFVTVLHACQPQTVLLALCGASPDFVARVERLVPPKDVKRLRTRLASHKNINLREVDAAQNQIAEMAMQLLANGKIGALENVSFTAAA